MSQKYEKLKTLLKELFQLDQPELDFGIYRILHARSAEVTQFLDKDLLPQVKQAFAQYRTADKAELEKELAKAIEAAQALGVDPESTQKVKDLRARLASEAVDTGALEAEVYDHLYSFFRRYYSEGDFLSKRVYKPGVYAIPYEGEEVKLHWANADQYYIKTSESFRDYAFRLRPEDEANPMRVHFKLADAAEGEHGNVKEQAGQERRFRLAPAPFAAIEDGELVIRFTYKPETEKQKDLNAEAEAAILALDDPALADWIKALGGQHVRADGTASENTRLRVHLDRYTARNTFDYFIHKDLGGFLRRELDFYIKNEVMHLDDVENETAPRVEQYLSKIKVIRRIAHKIIDFLAQLEDFQKKLWLKKKFVVETSYCIRLGVIPEEFYPEIAANDAQREEWVRLCAIDEIKGDLTTPGYSVPLTVEFLKAHPTLVVDTRKFPQAFTARLLEAIGNLDEIEDGTFFHSENFQALSLMQAQYKENVQCIYIDPPYNTGNDDFSYKDGYRRSSWLAMMADRLLAAQDVLADNGVIYISIDDKELERLKELCVDIFGRDNVLNVITVKTSDPSGHKTVNPSPYSCTEYVLMVAKSRSSYQYEQYYIPAEYDPNYRYFISNRSEPPSSWKIEPLPSVVAKKLGFDSVEKARKSLSELGFAKAVADFALEHANSVFQATAISKDAGSSILEAKSLSQQHPEKVIVVSRPDMDDVFIRGGRQIYFYSNKLRKSHETTSIGPTKPLTNLWTDIPWNGIANEGGVQLKNGKKPEKLLYRLIRVAHPEGSGVVLDFFAGSGTTAAVAAKLGRKWVAVEQSDQIANLALDRLQRVMYGDQTGVSALSNRGMRLFQVVHLESYEDTLNNLELRRTEEQQSLLDSPQAQGADGFREQYLLRYMLDVETRGSQSLLNVSAFMDPTAYRLKVKRPGSDESREVNVDLLETFNWLIGLKVDHIAAPRTYSAAFRRDDDPDLPADAPRRLLLDGRLKEDPDGPWWFRTVTGTTPDGRRTLVIWRKRPGGEAPEGIERDNLVLDEWFRKQGYSSKDSEFDLIYVNGDNNLENLKAPDDTWKVRLIEEDFFRLMFEMEGV
ncbi:site-specific DNA-methyltransferase [Burkholderia multivorans]|uniref:site-specific DNA-methyltransferase n=1 Tax=Burkholderia multivorans TaxID=87883 RepID=UPI000D0113EB|nr:site-specific DNA-methyltransferase [Burkholderia multivorans]PRH12762.1 site-specific DNA-methyltransferase [Burkholderia multivorans]